MKPTFTIHLTYLNFFLIFLSILFISNTSPITFSDVAIIATFLLLLFVSIIKKIKYDPIVFYISGAWILTNLISYLYNRTTFPTATIISYLLRMFIPYLTIKLFGNQYWIKLEKAIFYLTLISLVIYAFNLLAPGIFISLDKVFGNFAAKIYKEKASQAHFWYAFVYTFLGRTDSDRFRNCGFMWEPGAFAMILGIVILLNWFRNNFRIDFKIIVYLIALISTFSTMGYISLLFLILIYIVNKGSLLFKVLLFLSFAYFIPTVLDQDFIGPKIQQYITEAQYDQSFKQTNTGDYEMNRISTFIFSLEKVFRLPTGFGVVPDKSYFKNVRINLVGVNGLGGILVFWGWFGLIFLIYALKKFCKKIINPDISMISLALTISVILISFFSNPIERNFLLFALILTPFIKEFKENIIDEDIPEEINE